MPGEPANRLAHRAADAAAAGDRGEALRLYGLALEAEPGSPARMYDFALELSAAGDTGKARELLVEAFSLAPEDVDIGAELGRLEIDAGRVSAAAVILDRALEAAPDHPAALNNRGVAAFLKGRYPEAAGFFRRAAAADPGLMDAWFNLADTCAELGDTAGEKEARNRLEAPGGD